MKQGWEIKKLGEVATILNGYAFDSKLFSEDSNDMPLIRIRDIKRGYTETFYKGDFSEEYIIKKGDYLVGMDGEFNIAEWKGNDALLNQRVCKIVANDIVGRYLFWYMPVVLKQIEDATPFVTVKHLSSKQLLNTIIPIPPREEQERIVEELDCLSGVIEKKREQLKQLDALAQSIFYQMFGDIDEVVPLSVYIEGLSAGKSLAGDEECSNKVLKTGAVTYDVFDATQVKNLPLEYAPMPSHKVNAKDVLISRMNTAELVGACAYVWEIDDNIYLPDRLWRAEIKDNSVPIYLWKAITSNKAKEQIRSYASGTSGSMKNISKPSLMKVLIPNAPLSLQQEFADKIEAIEKQKELIKQSIAETEELFNSRMQYYFN